MVDYVKPLDSFGKVDVDIVGGKNASLLVRRGIDSIAVNPDALVDTRRVVAAIEADMVGSE